LTPRAPCPPPNLVQSTAGRPVCCFCARAGHAQHRLSPPSPLGPSTTTRPQRKAPRRPRSRRRAPPHPSLGRCFRGQAVRHEVRWRRPTGGRRLPFSSSPEEFLCPVSGTQATAVQDGPPAQRVPGRGASHRCPKRPRKILDAAGHEQPSLLPSRAGVLARLPAGRRTQASCASRGEKHHTINK
jgi:hypothetical protein